MSPSCTFEFDRSDPVFFSGEAVSGRVLLNTDFLLSIKEAYIKFEGIAKVRWEEIKPGQRLRITDERTVMYRGTETYLDTRTYIITNKCELAEGATHTYPFSLPLPLDCPSSCVEKYGKIAYEISFVIVTAFREFVFKQPLTALHTYDLNTHPELLIPLKCSSVKYFWCWPCSSGPVTASLSIPLGGYAPGQKIHYTLEVENLSSGHDLKGIDLSLVQVYAFKSTTPKEKTCEYRNILNRDGPQYRILPWVRRVFNSSLLIPPVPPSTQGQGIIKVRYHILMTIRTGDFHKNVDVIIPIVIGTIPLVPISEGEEIRPENDLPPSYDLCLPPSYEEATHIGERFIDIDIDEQNRTDNFIPKYPMYTDFDSPSAPPPYGEESPLTTPPPTVPISTGPE